MHRTAGRRVTTATVVATMALAVAACGGSTPRATSTTTSSVPKTVTTTQPSGTTTTPSTTPPSTGTTLFGSTTVKGTTIFSQEDAGDLTTSVFTVPRSAKHWDLAWSYDCPGAAANSVGPLQNFVFAVYKGRSKDTKDAGAPQAAASGTGTDHYSDTGTFTFHVGARQTCTWSLKAILPSG